MSNEPMQMRGPDGGGGRAMSVEEAQHLERVRTGRGGQYTMTLTVTPEYAALVLARYAPEGSNRPLRRGDVRRITRSIVAGRWKSRTHQGIAFDEAGNLSDGQHRLHACVAAKLPITLPATFGQPRDVFPAIDQNAPRGAADLMFAAGVEVNNPGDASAAARSLLILQRHDTDTRKEKIDKLAVVEFTEQNADELNEATRIGVNTAAGIKGGISRSQVATAAFLIRAACKDHVAVEDFFDRLKVGANLAPRSPHLLLRDGLKSGDVLTGNPVGDLRIRQIVGAVVNAWNLWRGRRATTTLKSIQWRAGQDFPQARP